MSIPQKIQDALEARADQIVALYGQEYLELAKEGKLSKKELEKLITEFPNAD